MVSAFLSRRNLPSHCVLNTNHISPQGSSAHRVQVPWRRSRPLLALLHKGQSWHTTLQNSLLGAGTLLTLFLLPQYVFRAEKPSVTQAKMTHEILVLSMATILKQSADFLAINKLLKVKYWQYLAARGAREEKGICIKPNTSTHPNPPQEQSYQDSSSHPHPWGSPLIAEINSCREPGCIKAHNRTQQRAFRFASFIYFLWATHEGWLTEFLPLWAFTGIALQTLLAPFRAHRGAEGIVVIPTPRLAGLLQMHLCQAPCASSAVL